MALQPPERIRHRDERCPVAQGAGLALDPRQIMPPLINGAARQMVRPLDDPAMFAQDMTFGGDHDPLRHRELLGKLIPLARPCRNLEHRLNRTAAPILADRVTRQTRPPLDLRGSASPHENATAGLHPITPCRSFQCPPAHKLEERSKTWVTSHSKFTALPGQLSGEINSQMY